ncbi:hypothetical protein [Asaia spathodeae]|uniref:Uncharacterized protein n=1 Tax=Asaia spathodeae TaxID=657016 RepID=A0ABX2P3G3_9PROT|nr:hypothetical protein [Asaia spathodeae]
MTDYRAQRIAKGGMCDTIGMIDAPALIEQYGRNWQQIAENRRPWRLTLNGFGRQGGGGNQNQPALPGAP